ncbi:MAG: hypothetical protein FWF57_03275 [Defluviitaleaceae bacterium]|nr:hypothetical protein [Defluviitaleaceae bacterium]
MTYKKATNLDHSFIDELLKLSDDDYEIGIAYPRGDLEDIETDLKDYNTTINNSFYIICDNNTPIGVIGELLDNDKVIIVGPIFKKEHHNIKNIDDILQLFLNKYDKHFTINFYIIDTNNNLSASVIKLGAVVVSKRISMKYSLKNHKKNNKSLNVTNIAIEDSLKLEQVSNLFLNNMPDYDINKNESVLSYTEEGYNVSVIFDGDVLAGAIIWCWYSDLFFGRIEYLCVDKNYRGLPFGENLIQFCLNEVYSKLDNSNIEKEHLNIIHLDLKKDNEVAFNLYKKAGFKTNFTYTNYRISKQ